MKKIKIGVQLYSLRSKMKDIESYTNGFKSVKEMGAEVVQVSGGYRPDSKTLAKLSKEFELPIVITHSSFDRITNDLDKLAEEHLEFGCKTIGIGMMPRSYQTKDMSGYVQFIDFLNEKGEALKKYDMKIAYHNHWFEFKKIDGKIVYDKMIEDTTSNVEFIPDTFWIKVAGYKPEDYITMLKDRVSTLHLKDYKKSLGVPIFRAVGKGDIDFASILKTAELANIENAVVELDLSPNPYKSMQFSMDTLKKLY